MIKNTAFFLLIFILVVYITVTVQAEQLSVRFDQNSINNSRLESSISFVGDIPYDTIDAVRNGITARLILTIQFVRGGALRGSVRKILKEEIETFNISYDVWENSFKLIDQKRKEEYYITYLPSILEKIAEVINPLSYSIPKIDIDEKLLLRVKIKIQTIKLYPPFGIFLVFFDPWNYESNWISSDIITEEENP
jgi:hypothetical protein